MKFIMIKPFIIIILGVILASIGLNLEGFWGILMTGTGMICLLYTRYEIVP